MRADTQQPAAITSRVCAVCAGDGNDKRLRDYLDIGSLVKQISLFVNISPSYE